MTSATCLTRMAEAGQTALPRICVAAAIRAVERLANHPDEHQRAIAVLAAQDLADALRDGSRVIEGLLLLLEQTEQESAPS